MKDYYYILGVTRTASPEEVRSAYRKLSLKFHPDKNDGDKFFEDRFKEINEAYEFLSNPVRRFNYDEFFVKKTTSQQGTPPSTQTTPRSGPPKPPDTNFWKRNSSTRTPPQNDLPRIISFMADKAAIGIGDTATFRWQVENATSVELRPFGMVAVSGEKTIKINGFNSPEGLHTLLVAYNQGTSINERVECKYIIKKKYLSPVEEIKATQQPVQPNKEEKSTKSWWDNQWIYPMIIPIGLFIYNHYYKSDGSPQKQAINIVSEQTAVDTTSLVHNSDEKDETEMPVLITEPENQISQWKGNQLKNGNSPFSSCFGKGKRGGRSWVLFQNQNGVDAVVCLINSVSGATIRNEYIKAGDSFEMSNVPVGTYYVKALYGNDWNPTLPSPCGSAGFFESDVSFSVSDGYSDAINVETSDDGYSTRYSTHTITLYPVANGNMSQRDIDASQFFGR